MRKSLILLISTVFTLTVLAPSAFALKSADTTHSSDSATVTCFVSSEEVGEDDSSVIVCKAIDNTSGQLYTDGRFILTLREDGGLDTDPADNGSTASSVIMEEVSDELGSEHGYGWVWAQYESENIIPVPEEIAFTIDFYNVSGELVGSTTSSLVVTNDSEGTINQIHLNATQDILNVGSSVSVLMRAQDSDEFGVEDLALNASVPSGTGLLTVDPEGSLGRLVSDDLIELVDGAYFFNVTAVAPDAARIYAHAYDEDMSFVDSALVMFTIL